MNEKRGCPSPYELKPVPGGEGWERLYPYALRFSSELKEDEDKTWVFDASHYPELIYPFDAVIIEAMSLGASPYVSRIFAIPPALGISYRIVNGYPYYCTHSVKSPALIRERVAYFEKRAGYYYTHWEDLYAKWEAKMRQLIGELKSIEIAPLPEYESDAVVFEGHGVSSGYRLLAVYDKLILNMFLAWQYHFEMLALTYMAYAGFFDFCQRAFPDISPQVVARMVSDPDSILFQPQRELEKLARLAVELGVAETLKQEDPPEALLAALRSSGNGEQWVAALEQVKEPWFYMSSGTGLSHQYASWIDDLRIPFSYLRTYIASIERNEDTHRPLAANKAERERMVAEYQALLPTEDDRRAFGERYHLACRTYPYAENHHFFVEHWHHTIFWGKVREFGSLLVEHGFLDHLDDIFYFQRSEVSAMLFDLAAAWAAGPGIPAQGPHVWPQEVAKRREVIQKLQAWKPPRILGTIPKEVADPILSMLGGITADNIHAWQDPVDDRVTELTGFPASPGEAEGPARVVATLQELNLLQPGEILVCVNLMPSWTPIFSRIRAAVTDIGGIASHAAIVTREYNLPCVVGTISATKLIRSGDRVRVDGRRGRVWIVERQREPSAPPSTQPLSSDA